MLSNDLAGAIRLISAISIHVIVGLAFALLTWNNSLSGTALTFKCTLQATVVLLLTLIFSILSFRFERKTWHNSKQKNRV